MSIQLFQTEQMSGYLTARLIGVGEAREASQQIEPIAEHCKRTKNNKLLIDTTRVDLKIMFMDRFLLGESFGLFARYGIKVAVVGRPEQVDPQKSGTLVAQNRGVKVETFTDFRAAEEWLLK